MKLPVSALQQLSHGGLALILLGCGGPPPAPPPPKPPFQLVSHDATVPANGAPIKVTLVFNAAVRLNSINPGTNLVVSGKGIANAPGTLMPAGNNTVTFQTTAAWGAVTGPGGADAGFTVTLRNTIRSQDGRPLTFVPSDQCGTGTNVPVQPPNGCSWLIIVPG